MSTFMLALTQPALIAWLLKATMLLVAALAGTSLLRRASAGTRHLVWLATLAGILLLPAVSLWTPVRLAIVPTTFVPSLPQVIAPARTAPISAAPAEVKLATIAAPRPSVTWWPWPASW